MKKPTFARKPTRATFRPSLEALETRLTPTTYAVSSLADSGPGTLRAAITNVNGDTSPDVIDFSVAGVIQLTSGALPAITNTVKIDGRTAPGFAGVPVVEIDNNGLAGVTLKGSESNLAGLSIVNASGPGVALVGQGNHSAIGNAITVVGNYIGLALDGSVAANMGAGLVIDNSVGDVIGGTAAVDRNVISGNGGSGIQVGVTVQAGLRASILGNFIGTDITGQAAEPNQGNGITVPSTGDTNGLNGSTIGGADPGAGNTIAFNAQYGVLVNGGLTAISENSIFSNVTGGILLTNNGNNNLQSPVLTAVIQFAPTTVEVSGTLMGLPNASYLVEIFATPTGTPSGQGQNFIGSVNAVTNADGVATFSSSFAAASGNSFTATTSVSNRATSAFSPPLTVAGNANTIFVANAYALLLNRTPDPTSSFWVNALNNGATPASVVLGIEGGTEYLNDQVVAMYKRYLQRSADPGGEQAWTNFLLAGGTLEQVAEGLVTSQEYFVLQGGTNQGYITGLYRDVLNRAPSTAELAGWETALDAGATRASVAVDFLTSQEYRTNLVQADYTTFLLRPADQGGLATWVNALNAGATDQQVLAQIFGSPEGYQVWS